MKLTKRCTECKHVLPLKKFGSRSIHSLKRSHRNPIQEKYDICIECWYKTPEGIEHKLRKKGSKKVDSNKETKRVLKKFAKELILKCTKFEQLLYDKLNELYIAFVPQYPVYDSHHKYIVDTFLPVYSGCNGVIIEVDGEYHQTEEQVLKDKNRDDYLHLRGMKVIRVTNDQVENRMDEILMLISKFDIKRSTDIIKRSKDETIRLV